MPLKLAYMSSSGKLYQFGFNETLTNNGSISWQLDLRPFNTKEQPMYRFSLFVTIFIFYYYILFISFLYLLLLNKSI